jgi:DNA polymerase I-like protein with 3'-5' exonuclease and polymerase domains
MLRMYQSGDPYLSYTKAIGAVPAIATKQSHEAVRNKFKTMLLATMYGIGAKTLAGRLGVSDFESHEMLQQHREQFAQYLSWSEHWLQSSQQTGVMRTAFGWTCRTGITEFNERSICNWPNQSTGAEILRIACILMVRHGLKLLASIHDAVLIEAPIERIEADVKLAQEIMRRASRIVLNANASGTHELRTDATIVRYPDRYQDLTRGEAIWKLVNDELRKLDEQESTSTVRTA